jgi:hypothetical protein
MLAILGIVCVLSGIAMARLSHKSYAIVLASGYFFVVLAMCVAFVDLLNQSFEWYYIAGSVAVGAIVWLAAKASFLWLWSSIWMLCLALLLGIDAMVESSIISGMTVMIVFAVSLIMAILLRKHASVLVVAISSGYDVGIGLTLVLLAFLDSASYSTALTASAGIVLASVLAGIYYQYGIDRRLLEKSIGRADDRPVASD